MFRYVVLSPYTGLHVAINITYNLSCDFTHATPPYYQPATTVNLTCVAYGATGHVTYQWSSIYLQRLLC